MRVLVTGAAGYIGKAVVEVLRPHHPLCLPPYGVIQFASFYKGNEDLWQFMLRAQVNLCESVVPTSVSECRGWGDRQSFEASMAASGDSNRRHG